jgi:PAS domain S-box-containing protein
MLAVPVNWDTGWKNTDMVHRWAIWVAIGLAEAGVFLYDVFLDNQTVLPGPPYAIPIFIAVLWLTPRMVGTLSIWALALHIVAFWFQGGSLSSTAPLYLVATASFGILSTVLSTNMRRVRQGEERYHSLFDNSMDAIILADSDSRVVDFNPRAAVLFGYSSQELFGKPLFEIVDPEYQDRWRRRYNQLKTKDVARGECRLRLQDGAVLETEFSVVRAAISVYQCVFHDITERREREQQRERLVEENRQRAEELETLMDLAPAAIWVANDAECRQITGNRAANLFLEAEEGENVSVGPVHTTAAGLRRYFRAGIELQTDELPMQEAAAKNSEVRDVEFDVQLPSCQWRSFLGSAIPLRNNVGAVRGCIATFVDITERKQIEVALRESQQLAEQRAREADAGRQILQRLLQQMPEGVIIVEAPGMRVVTISDYTKYYLGIGQEEFDAFLAGERVEGWSMVYPDGTVINNTDIPLVRVVRQGKSISDQEMVIRRANGDDVSILINSVPVRDASGSIIAGISVWRDITERKQAELERARLLDENRRRAAELDAIIQHLPATVLVYDRAGRIIRRNPAAERSTGYSPEEERLSLPERAALLEYLQEDGQPLRSEDSPSFRAVAGERVAGMVIGIRRRGEGPARWIFSSSAPIYGGDGTQIGAVVTSTNITALKDLDRLKDEFLSIAAHELRTPMTAMKGYAQLLQRWAKNLPDAERWARPLQTIDQQVNRMTKLIEQLLDVSRIQMGRLVISPHPMDLVQLVVGAAAEAQIGAETHRIEVVASTPEVMGDWDALRLQQVVANLLSNAIRYSPEGTRIGVSVGCDQTQAVVAVKDEGIGISPEAIPHLFERNYRTTEATLSHSFGMGLGLYVAKGIIDAHEGRIWVESEIDKGSSFYFALPLDC